MPKQPKETFSWSKFGLFFARVGMSFAIMYAGYMMFEAHGDFTYNSYLHAVRKMALPSTKPSDPSPLGMSWEDLNKLAIKVEGGVILAAGLLVLVYQDVLASILMIIGVLFMMATKDNIQIKSDIQAIKREKGSRLERFSRDISMLGVAMLIMGSYLTAPKKKLPKGAKSGNWETDSEGEIDTGKMPHMHGGGCCN